MIEFVDDLPDENQSVTGTGNRAWGHDIAPQLKANPGRWALILTGELRAQQIHNRRRSIVKATTNPWKPMGAFEAKTFKVDSELKLYARYVGGEGQ